MKILAACEESQAVTCAMRERGHEAYSCDILSCSGEHPEWHIKQDVTSLIQGFCSFHTCDGREHHVDGRWDMLIAFPPCTHLAAFGARYFEEKRKDGRQQAAAAFFMQFADADCDRIAIENPVGIMSSLYRKPDQIIQPWQFGHGFTKATCLWLKGLPLLEPTDIVAERRHWVLALGPGPDRAVIRSRTFPGVAKAMACQWA